ncbi:RagB/SusD family nutrient uptake outer membrane protein [Paraflavisolibacter sp. H34]|uniref:RagB/SusD family nutrient uptake outer membrane protein n=1 Tax=Huijunlia imazamoxiresistens TaxID=3127457 RepID=UPI00301ABB11
MKIVHKSLLALMLLSGAVSCKKDFLNENPQSFFSTSNAFSTVADFNASVNNLYALVRNEFYTVNDYQPFHYLYRTDVAFEITVTTPNLDAEISPTSSVFNSHWPNFYKIVSEANTIIGRLPASQLTAAEKTAFEAKAKFFRAFAYRSLAYLWGDVPLVLEEVKTEKTDLTRAPRKTVYAQAIEDLKFAAQNLPTVAAAADGEISNLAAQHLLSEVYLADGQYQNAVTAASAVIDDPNMGLMTARFGKRSTVTPGDVYWDLFQTGNQNRKGAGNKEGIWVIQFEPDAIGGGASTAGAQSGVYALERVHAPLVRDLRVNGVTPFQWPIGDYTGGRGVGFLAPSLHFMNTVYQSDFNNDIRNANHNFVREFVANNPASPLYGKVISTRNVPAGTTGVNGAAVTSNKPDRAFYPYQTKATTPYNHPAVLYVNPGSSDPILKYQLKGSAGGTYTDQYMFRLAETYLLRAEAYLGLNNNTAAANDINKVRSRSNASAAAPGDVTLDYILDERIRELGVEEKRMLTLCRLGKFYDRVSRLNPFYGPQMKPHFNLWPIPFSEIERNRSVKMPQNPGYPQ